MPEAKTASAYAAGGLKRSLDLLGSGVGLLFLWPFLLLIAVLIKVDSRGPVFFRGSRIGKDGIPFRIFKFRTMTVDAQSSGPLNVGEKDPRVTRVGRLLRKTKLDELPQLLNVLMGEMSLVGPRPDVAEYVALYTEEQRGGILPLKPGITDWASVVHFDQSVDFTRWENPDEEFVEQIRPVKVRLQLFYSERASFREDLSILLWTFRKVILRDRTLPADLARFLDREPHLQAENGNH